MPLLFFHFVVFLLSPSVNPVVKWAQNTTHIFVSVKLSHRHDAPGCLDVRNESMKMDNGTVNYTASGVSAGVPLNFEMFLTLNRTIDNEDSIWQKESVGTFSMTLKKHRKTMWKHLVDSKEQISRHQIQLWWEMGEKNQKAFDRYLDRLEEEEDLKERVHPASKKQLIPFVIFADFLKKPTAKDINQEERKKRSRK